VAYRYFELPRDPRLQVAIDDGRRYLVRNGKRWDAIIIDAFFSDAIPFHLFTAEFLELARSRLNPSGVILTNTIGAIAGDQSRLFRSIYRTYRSVFPTVVVHPTILGNDESDDTVLRNLILVATEQAAPSKPFLVERWQQIAARFPRVPDLRGRIEQRHDRPISLDGVPTLTDQYAPTDALLLIE
jgi:spermidine synthase